MSLSNPDSMVTEQRLSEFYASILPYLGGMPNDASDVDYSNTDSGLTADNVQDAIDEVVDDLAGKANTEPYFEQSVTLSTSQTTTVTFSNAAFTANSIVEPAISVWGIFPDDVTVASGSCTVVMPKVSTAQTVTVGIFIKR